MEEKKSGNLRIIVLLLSLFVTYTGYSCDCGISHLSTYELREVGYKVSKYVVLGRIISSNDDRFSIEVVESFKGDKKVKEFIECINYDSCSLIPKKNEIWILYVENNEDGVFYVNYCYSNRKIKSKSALDFPLPDFIENKSLIKLSIEQLCVNEELNWLRYKNSRNIIKFSNDIHLLIIIAFQFVILFLIKKRS